MKKSFFIKNKVLFADKISQVFSETKKHRKSFILNNLKLNQKITQVVSTSFDFFYFLFFLSTTSWSWPITN